MGKKRKHDKKLINNQDTGFLVKPMAVEVGKYGRIVLPKDLRKRYDLDEDSRLIVRERRGEIILIPVKRYKNPTGALYGSLKTETQMDDPKEYARSHIAKKLREETQ